MRLGEQLYKQAFLGGLLRAGGKALSMGTRTGARGLGGGVKLLDRGLAAAPGTIGRGAMGLGKGIAATPRAIRAGAAGAVRLPVQHPKATAGALATAPLWKPLWDRATSQPVSSYLNEKYRLDKPEHASPIYSSRAGEWQETPQGAYRSSADSFDEFVTYPENYLQPRGYFVRPREPYDAPYTGLNPPEPHHVDYMHRRLAQRVADTAVQRLDKRHDRFAPHPRSSAAKTRGMDESLLDAPNQPNDPAYLDSIRALYRLGQATGDPRYQLLLRANSAFERPPTNPLYQFGAGLGTKPARTPLGEQLARLLQSRNLTPAEREELLRLVTEEGQQ